jgi:nucleoside-diphosphate-sugar epimerase
MRVLLTGASGMVGANLVRRLAQNHEVTVLVRTSGVPARLAGIASDLRLLRADLLDGDAVGVRVAEARPEIVFHLASTPFNPPPTAKQHFDTNVQGTINLMAALGRVGVRRVIVTGTAAQYGDGDNLKESDAARPSTLLGISKQCAAEIVHGYGRMAGFETVEPRLFTPYGPWDRPGRLIPHTIRAAHRGEEVKLGCGRQERDWTHIDDVVVALIRSMAAPLPDAARINICSGKGVAVREVAAQILALLGDPVPLRLGVFPTRPDEIWKISGDNTRAKEWLGWSPTIELNQGLQSTIEWYKAHPGEIE